MARSFFPGLLRACACRHPGRRPSPVTPGTPRSFTALGRSFTLRYDAALPCPYLYGAFDCPRLSLYPWRLGRAQKNVTDSRPLYSASYFLRLDHNGLLPRELLHQVAPRLGPKCAKGRYGDAHYSILAG